MKRIPIRPPFLASSGRLFLILAVALVFAVDAAGQNESFDPAKQKRLSIQTSELAVSLDSREACAKCPSVSRFLFRVRERKSGISRSFALENETAQVDEIHLSGQARLMVFGRVLANTSIVTILNTQTGQSVDSFFCFRPRASSDGRFVAFVKVYPAHFSPNVSAQYIIYDVELSPQANRSSGIPLDNRIDVGRAVFPPGAENKPGDNLNVSPENRHAMASLQFHWHESRVMFVDRAGGNNSLVLIDLSGWPHKPQVRTLLFPTETIVNAQRCPDFNGKLNLAYHVVGLTPEGENRVKVRFRSSVPACLRRHTLSVAFEP